MKYTRLLIFFVACTAWTQAHAYPLVLIGATGQVEYSDETGAFITRYFYDLSIYQCQADVAAEIGEILRRSDWMLRSVQNCEIVKIGIVPPGVNDDLDVCPVCGRVLDSALVKHVFPKHDIDVINLAEKFRIKDFLAELMALSAKYEFQSFKQQLDEIQKLELGIQIKP